MSSLQTIGTWLAVGAGLGALVAIAALLLALALKYLGEQLGLIWVLIMLALHPVEREAARATVIARGWQTLDRQK